MLGIKAVTSATRAGLTAFAALICLATISCGEGSVDRGPTPTPDGLPDDPEALMSLASRITFLDVTSTVTSEPDAAAVRKMGASGDERYIPVLVDILGFPWLLDEETTAATLQSLSDLSGVTLAEDNRDGLWWVEWLSARPEIESPPGYARWKGNLYTRLVDPRIGSFLVDAEDPAIRIEEVVWGGVPTDGIPDLQDPPVVRAADATYMLSDDRVFGVAVGGESRAYPLRIMNAHEMANDVVGGTGIALAYCTLCGSGVAYVSEVAGEKHSFGTSGLLYRANKLMYDRNTQTLWVQFGGAPVIGPLQESGIKLETLPVALTTWAEWVALHPDTTVLDIETGVYPPEAYVPESDPRSAYYEYRSGDGPMFPIHERSDLLPERELVAGLSIAGEAVAYPLDLLDDRGVVNDEVGGTEVVLIGQGARAYDRDDVTFGSLQGDSLVDDNGNEWRITEESLVSNADQERVLPRLESQVAYWFAWFQFHPATRVFE